MPDKVSIGVYRRLTSYLRRSLINPRIVKFGIVGATGVGVNMGSLFLLTEYGRIPYFVGSLVAIELSILSNFWLNLIWTWKDRSESGSSWTKLWRYHVGASITGFLCNYLILVGLTELFGVKYMISNLIGIGVGTIGNFVINDLWTFKNRAEVKR